MTVLTKKAKVLAFSNHKGGVGKTCSACNIGAGLAEGGKKVLLVDFDPQANLSSSLGAQNCHVDIYRLLIGQGSYENAVCSVTENLDIIPSSLDLAGIENELANEPGREFLLQEALNDATNEYDYIIIDCPPSLSLLTQMALVCANEVIVPVSAEPLPVQGIEKLLQYIEKIQKRQNKHLRVSGVLITKFDSRKTINRRLSEVLEDHFKDVVFKTRIRDNITLAESPHFQKDVFRYEKKSYGAKDYKDVCKEILERN
jgi:chromosome partitioning protein